MKKILILTIAIFTSLSAIVFNSCKVKPCEGEVCANSGVCEGDGVCKCQVGYEGPRCETVMRNKFIGLYSVSEDGSLSSYNQFSTSINANNTALKINEVEITNFQNYFTTPVKAYVKNDTINIPSQVVQGNTVEGFGFIRNTNSINQHYYEHATIEFFYSVKNSIGELNQFAYPDPGAGKKSDWSK